MLYISLPSTHGGGTFQELVIIKQWWSPFPIVSLNVKCQLQFSVINTKCLPHVICHSLKFICGNMEFTMLQLLSLTK